MKYAYATIKGIEVMRALDKHRHFIMLGEVDGNIMPNICTTLNAAFSNLKEIPYAY